MGVPSQNMWPKYEYNVNIIQVHWAVDLVWAGRQRTAQHAHILGTSIVVHDWIGIIIVEKLTSVCPMKKCNAGAVQCCVRQYQSSTYMFTDCVKLSFLHLSLSYCSSTKVECSYDVQGEYGYDCYCDWLLSLTNIIKHNIHSYWKY